MATIVSLTQEEAASSGYTHKVIVKAADIAALTSGTAYSLYPGYAGSTTNTNLLVKGCDVFIKTAFSGTGTLVAVIGDGTTANAYCVSTTWKTAGWIAGALTTSAVPAGDIIKFTPTAGTDITTFTAGEAHIFLTIVDGDTLAKAG